MRQLESLVNAEVWTDAGRKIGKITDYRFDRNSGEVSDYLLTTSGLSAVTDGVYRLPPGKILSLGRRVVVETDTVDQLEIYREGIKRKLGKVGELLREEYSQVTEEAKSLTQQAKSVTQRTRERMRLLAEQAIETSQTLAEQAKETSQRLAEQVKEQAEILREELAEDVAANRDREAVHTPPPETDWLEEDWDIETPPTTPPTYQPPVVKSVPPEAPRSTDRHESPPVSPEVMTDRASNNEGDSDSWDDGWDIETPPPQPLPPRTIDTVATVTTDFSVPLPDSILEDDFWDIETPPETPTVLNSGPVPSEPLPSEPVPSEPLPSEPLPSEPLPD